VDTQLFDRCIQYIRSILRRGSQFIFAGFRGIQRFGKTRAVNIRIDTVIERGFRPGHARLQARGHPLDPGHGPIETLHGLDNGIFGDFGTHIHVFMFDCVGEKFK